MDTFTSVGLESLKESISNLVAHFQIYQKQMEHIKIDKFQAFSWEGTYYLDWLEYAIKLGYNTIVYGRYSRLFIFNEFEQMLSEI